MIASDTDVYLDEVWPHLENLKLDALVIECTRGTIPGSNMDHLNLEGVQTMLEKMKHIQTVTEQTSIYATHFARRCVPPHEELSKILQNIGVYCVYDGLVLEV